MTSRKTTLTRHRAEAERLNAVCSTQSGPFLGGYDPKPESQHGCPTKVFADRNWDPELQAPIPPGALARMSAGVEFEKAVAARLADSHTVVSFDDLDAHVAAGDLARVAFEIGKRPGTLAVIPDPERDENGHRIAASQQRRQLLTLASMMAGVNVIWNCRLPSVDHRVGEPDFIVRVSHRSADGTFAYAPGDVKAHKVFAAGGTTVRRYRTGELEQLGARGPSLGRSTTEYAGSPHIGDSYQLVHYHRMLDVLGYAQADAPLGALFGNEDKVIWWDLEQLLYRNGRLSAAEQYDAGFDRALAEAKHAADGGTEPLNAPVWKQGCKECPWRTVCKDQLVAEQHISLLQGVSPARIDPYNELEVTSTPDVARLDWRTAALVDAKLPVADLAAAANVKQTLTDVTVDVAGLTLTATSGDETLEDFVASRTNSRRGTKKMAGWLDACARAGVRKWSDFCKLDEATAAFSTVTKPPTSLAATIDIARVSLTGNVYRSRDAVEVVGPRADFEVHVDLEDFEGFVYLINGLHRWREARNGSTRLRLDQKAHVTWKHTPEAEARNFARFWTWLDGKRRKAARHNWTFQVIVYSGHERRTFVRLAGQHAGIDGVPSVDEVEAFFDEHVLDLYEVIRTATVWPTESLSLKAVAKHIQYVWRDEDPSGDNSMAWYQDAVFHPDRKVRAENRARILAYCEDDCAATEALMVYLEKLTKVTKDPPGARLKPVSSLDRRFRSAARRRRPLLAQAA